MKSRWFSVLASAAAVLICGGASDCGATRATDYDFDTSQQEQVWAFVTHSPTESGWPAGSGQMWAKVIMRGCTAPQCNGATLESVRPLEWVTRMGNAGPNACYLHWHISGQVSGDLVSFTLHGSECETTVQGRSVSGGRLNARFGNATATVTGAHTMSWNGYTTLFGGNQPFEGSQNWLAVRCDVSPVPCPW